VIWRIESTTAIRANPQQFVAAFARRVETGLVRGASERRSRYRVTHQDANGLAFRAADWLTAFNVGLNDVQAAASSDGRVSYTIEYQRWAAYVLVLGATVGIVLMAILLMFDMRGYIARHRASRFPGLSTDQNMAIAWAMAVFWGFIWPWILIALHKWPLRRLMDQIIAEVDAAALSEAR